MTRRTGRCMNERAETDGRAMAPPRRAFTIVELLIVMIVIVLVISILLPAIGGVRDTARAATTSGLMNDVISSVQRFSVDKRRLPGYFSARELGAQINETRGMSAAENALLELAGGIVGDGSSAAGQPPNTVAANPTADPARDVYVDVKQIGLGKAYFTPPQKHYVAQTADTPTSGQQIGVAGHTGPEGTDSLPDLVDAWGQPILFWVEDESATAPVNPPNVIIVKRNTTTPGPTPAHLYWASNAAFLKSDMLGKKIKNQNFVTDEVAHSIIGGGNVGGNHDPIRSLESLLGNPNYPYKGGPSATIAMEHPSRPRAPFIAHSAGRDGYYFGSKDKGAKRFPNGYADYNYVFWSTGQVDTTRNLDKNGKPTNDDLARDFDDILTTSAN